MKKAMLILLAAIYSASMLSCGDAEQKNNDSRVESTSATEVETEEAYGSRASVKSSAPESVRFDGKTVTILTRDEQRYEAEFFAEESNGDTMNDAIFERNLWLSDRLGIEIKVISRPGGWADHNQFVTDVVKDVMSGTSTYDIVSFYSYCMPMIASQNVFCNLHEIEHLDLSNPWWRSLFVENAGIYGKLYTASGDICLTTVSGIQALFFNKTLTDSYFPDENLYKKVLDGEFTSDYLFGLTKDIYEDLNDDGIKNKGDFFGLNLNGALDTYAVGCNVSMTKKTSDGGYEWDMFTERNDAIFESFFDAFNNNRGIFFEDKQDDMTFINRQEIFVSKAFVFTEKLRSFNDEYGILPLPKFDEAQERYCSIATDDYSQVAIPVTCGDKELAGAFLELAGEYSYKYVIPDYYEVAMKGKYLRDDESCQMFDLVIDSAWDDFAYINSSMIGQPVNVIRQSEMHKDGVNFVSRWDSVKGQLESALEEFIENYKNG